MTIRQKLFLVKCSCWLVRIILPSIIVSIIFFVKTHRFALDPDDYDATAGCPGGDLVTCIDVCPGFNKVAFGLCVTECGKRCP